MNKYAIITGVSSGIGECIAENFIKEGICVFGIDKNKPNNNEIEYFKCDIRNEEEIINIINEIKKKTDFIDYLINSAGIFCYKERNLIQNLSKEEWQNVIDVNLTGNIFNNKIFYSIIKKIKKW